MCIIEKVTALGRVTAIGYRPAIGCNISMSSVHFLQSEIQIEPLKNWWELSVCDKLLEKWIEGGSYFLMLVQGGGGNSRWELIAEKTGNTIIKCAWLYLYNFCSPPPDSVTIFSNFFALLLHEQKMATATQLPRTSCCRPWQLGQPCEQLCQPRRVEQMSFSAVLPGGRHYFSPHKMLKNHWFIVTLPL